MVKNRAALLLRRREYVVLALIQRGCGTNVWLHTARMLAPSGSMLTRCACAPKDSRFDLITIGLGYSISGENFATIMSRRNGCHRYARMDRSCSGTGKGLGLYLEL